MDRCIWAVVLPLLDMGYQVDVRVLNAAHFGAPQNRPVNHPSSFFLLLNRQLRRLRKDLCPSPHIHRFLAVGTRILGHHTNMCLEHAWLALHEA